MGKKAANPAGGGQMTLFSFFAKKPEEQATPKSTPKTPSGDGSSAARTNQATPPKKSSSSPQADWEKVKVGTRLAVYWPNDDDYYDATVQNAPKTGSMFTLLYDDGEMERLDLANEKFRLLDEHVKKNKAPPQESSPARKKRRRQIQEDREVEFDGEVSDNDDDESAYMEDPQEDAADDEEEEEAQWMVTDDEDDQEVIQKKAKKKLQKFRVTQVQATSSDPGKTPKSKESSTTSYETPRVTKTTGERGLFGTLNKKQNGGTNSTESIKVTPAFSATKRTPPSSSSLSPVHVSQTGTKKGNKPLPFLEGVVNPPGSHVHNHLSFLQNPKDSHGRTPDHPLYDPKTLKVNYVELGRLQGSKSGKLSPAARQWWEIKAQYFDSVLLFKTGKFYEMFHMDADVGVQVLGFCYMKSHVAHAGFPESAYGKMSERLVRAGYKVTRVEQTETPQAMKERNKNRRKNTPAAKVVNREVCSILTCGTRTFCYLDDDKGLAHVNSGNSTGNGPLLAIREVLIQDESVDSQQDSDDSVKAVCEYGITLVDAVRATVTMGQFADDILRSRMNTLLASFSPSEILIEGGEDGASPALLSLLESVRATTGVRLERVHTKETFPKSTAIDANVRRKMERTSSTVRPWDVKETMDELFRRKYYPRPSKGQGDSRDTSRWPHVLHVVVQGKADLALSSFGAALYYLQRNLIDQEILGFGTILAYVPPATASCTRNGENGTAPQLMQAVRQQQRQEDGFQDTSENPAAVANDDTSAIEFETSNAVNNENAIDHLALDGTTLQNLEILFNAHSHTVSGSLWSKINHTKSPHGSRLLRAWLLRPLFRKADIDRRADAVEELVSGAAAMAMSEARNDVLAKCGDIERLLSRVHSMGGGSPNNNDGTSQQSHHPNERSVLYETAAHTKRKVGDFSKVLHGLRHATRIPELFHWLDIQSPLLKKIVLSSDKGGCFPSMEEQLDWFFTNFDCTQAARGMFEPSRGVDEAYDDACDTIERIQRQLDDYKNEMCGEVLVPSAMARSQWKYINTNDDSKDKYLIELPAKVRVPDDFLVTAKRGKGDKQVNKYRTPVVVQLVAELEHALDIQKVGKEKGMQLVFARFDKMRNLWAGAAQATAMLDALGALAQTCTKPGYARPTILDCPPDAMPCIRINQGRHPCVESTHSGGEFIPNDLSLGDQERVLLLSGPNMGGKSTLLRQTCLIAILAQVGCYVPAEECSLTPVDRIFTRLGATDRILMGQSTFFVELAETSAALRGATRRSLVIMDELGRGTATFDGTAIASATVKHLVDQNRCLTLFATHYHSLLNDWRDDASVRLGHMECLVEGSDALEGSPMQTGADNEEEAKENNNITFLYTLGEGACPKSFGINVARLAALPEEVLQKAEKVSSNFEAEMTSSGLSMKVTPANATQLDQSISEAIENDDWTEVEKIWGELRM